MLGLIAALSVCMSFCVLTPLFVEDMLYLIFVLFHVTKIRVLVFRFELSDINSFVNALIYGMRHEKHTKAYLHGFLY